MDRLPEMVNPIVERWFERLRDEHGETDLGENDRARLARVVACSDFAGNVLIREWSYFRERLASMGRLPDGAELRAFAESEARGDTPIEDVKAQLRRFRHRYLVEVLWSEVEGSCELTQSLNALSHNLQSCLSFQSHYRIAISLPSVDGGDSHRTVCPGVSSSLGCPVLI